ncbi:MAG: hypothetical protein R2711_18495 [Acidimicrobiales bacterium]
MEDGSGGLGAGSRLDLGALDLGVRGVPGPIRIAKGSSGWSLPTVPSVGALLQQLDVSFVDGVLEGGRIRLGDLAPGDLTTPTVAEAGGWLPVGGLTIDHDARTDTWIVDGFLDQPRVDVGGTVDLDDGRVAAATFEIDHVDLGAFATFDLRMSYSAGRTFGLTAELVGDALEGRPSGTGTLTFDDAGAITAGSLRFAEIPIGDLLLIDGLQVSWLRSQGRWSASGEVAGTLPGSEPSAITGSLGFDDGVLVAAELTAQHLPLGPSLLDTFVLTLDRNGSSGTRETRFSVAGTVRGPAVESGRAPVATVESFSGGARLLDGELAQLDLVIPHLEVPGLAYLEDVSVGYLQQGSSARLSGSGTVATAGDGTEAGPAASFEVLLDDGEVERLTLQMDRLPLAGMLTVDDLVATFDRTGAGPGSCSGVDGRDAAVLALSGSVRGSAVSGCVAFAGRRLVGAELRVARLEVADLISVRDFEAVFAQSSPYEVALEGGRDESVELSRSTLELAGTIDARGGGPTAFGGSLVLVDGGVATFELTADRIPISSTVRLEDVSVAYDGGGRFDGRADRSFSISGDAVHGGGTTTLDGELAFGATGQLDLASLRIGDLPLGPVVLEDFAFLFDRTDDATRWSIDAKVTAPDNRSVVADVSGRATFVDGALTQASLAVPRFSAGELVMVEDLAVSFQRLPDGAERWAGAGTVASPDGSRPRADVEVQLAPDGTFRSGLVTADDVRWGGLFHLQDLRLVGARANGASASWSVSASLSVGGGATTSVTGSLVLADGRAISGSIGLRNLSIAELVRITSLTITASDRGDSTVWSTSAVVAFGEGSPVTTQGSMAFRRGVLTDASLRLGNAPIGELFRIDSFQLDYEQGRTWSASGSVTDQDGTSTFGGSVQFTDGRVSAGSLQLSNLQLGPLDLSSLTLAVGPADAPGPAVCGVADTAGAGVRYAASATVRSRDGDTTSLAGRLRIDEGNITEGRFCGSDLKFADLVILDSVSLAYSSTVGAQGRTIAFAGSATAQNPANPGSGSSASVAFSIRDRQLQSLDVDVAGIEVGDLLKLANLSLTYDRTQSSTAYAFGATVVQDGPDATLAGDLLVDDGTITGGSLTATEVRFGDLFVLEDLELSYFGRALSSGSTGSVSAGANHSCSATPNDSNVPGGVPRGNGSFSQFTAAATVRANGDTFAARGQLLFGDGDLVGFDLTLACLPLGDFKTLEAVRIAKRPGQLTFSGRLQDPDGTSGASGSFVFDDGRLTGGQIELQQVPIGPIQLHRLRVAIGATATGTTEYGLTVVLNSGDNPPAGGGGSLIMDDGRLVGGSLDLSGIKLFDLFRLDELELAIDGSTPGRVRFSVGLGITFPPTGGSGGRGGHFGQGIPPGGSSGPGGEVQVSMTMSDGRITAGSFTLGAVELFDAIPLGRVSASFDSVEQRWSASLAMQIGQNGPSFVVGTEFLRGKLISGAIGFDLDGDGEPDGSPGQSPPAGGNARMSWFPLKAAYLVYCSSAATADYCPGNGVSLWAGRLAMELPTDAAPAIDVSIEVRDGVLVDAQGWIDFGVGIPVYPAVWLESLGIGFGLTPFHANGSIGLSLGTGAVDIASVEGWVAAGEGPRSGPARARTTTRPTTSTLRRADRCGCSTCPWAASSCRSSSRTATSASAARWASR